MTDIVTTKKALLRPLGRVMAVAEKKSTMPALACVHITQESPGLLRLRATDLYLSLTDTAEMTAEATKSGKAKGPPPVEVKFPEEGLAVQAKELLERIQVMPDGPIVLSIDGTKFEVKAQGHARRFRMQALPGSDYPSPITPDDGSASVTLPASTLRDLCEKVVCSISDDETRAHLNAALLDWKDGALRMTSTDGHRLHRHRVSADGSAAAISSLLIPKKAIKALQKFVSDCEASDESANIKVTQSGSNVFFDHGAASFVCRTVDAQFPPADQVIPQNAPHHCTAPRAALLDALKAVGIAADSTTNGVKLTFAKETLTLESQDSKTAGDATDEVPIHGYEGTKLSIGFNGRYIVEALSVIETDEVALEFSGAIDPLVVRPMVEGGAEAGFLAVLMPMRI